MAKTRDQKKEMVSILENISKESKSVVFVNFTKLLVKDETALRNKLRENGLSYKVVKKTLLKKGFGNSSVSGEMPDLPGMMAIAYGDDLIAPAREVYDFQKTRKDNVAIVGGVFEGKYMTKEEMMSIATIPSTQVLYGQFVNLINTPIQQFVTALSKIAEQKTA
jgi:large subunit ribosomal protein L10